MIPLDLSNPVILRRTLEELETRLIVVATPISPIDQLPLAATLEEAVAKINELVAGHNATVAALNATNTSDRP